jgi:hypothetical protein
MKNIKLFISKVLIAAFAVGISLSGCRFQEKRNLNELATPSEGVLLAKTCPPTSTVTMKSDNHIGLQISSESTEFESVDSVLLLGGVNNYSHQVSHVIENQEQHYFWLEEICNDENGKERAEVIDEVILPPLNDSDFASAQCVIVGDTNTLAAAIGKADLITRAWTLDSKKWNFEEVSADRLGDISCERK